MTAVAMTADAIRQQPPAGTAIEVITEPLGGSALSRAIQQGGVPAHWKLQPPATVPEWLSRIDATRQDFARRDWLGALDGAISASGVGRDRLERVAAAGGVLVTTGQQPGLFGGPVYTWSKALSALALADAIEAATGVPAAPLFWAATDDADLLEAQSVWIAGDGGAALLIGSATAPVGTPAAIVPQGDLRAALDALARSAGSIVDAPLLDVVDRAYGDSSATIGDAFVSLLEAVLAPLGIAVLDASHEAVRRAGAALLENALLDTTVLLGAMAQRNVEIREAGFDPQVEDVAGLTPVFVYEHGVKRRVPVPDAVAMARRAGNAALGPNVLLRPVMEAAILPTVAYVAGPGELAYFAQVTALADSLGARMPVAVPRWSATIVEPRMQRLLDRLHVDRHALADPHAADIALARARMPRPLDDALRSMREGVDVATTNVVSADETGLLPPGVIDGFRRRVAHQLARLDRRVLAAVKRHEYAVMRDVATARGYFYPGGKRQERTLSLVPTLLRAGRAPLEAMLREARGHARTIIAGGTPDRPGTAA